MEVEYWKTKYSYSFWNIFLISIFQSHPKANIRIPQFSQIQRFQPSETKKREVVQGGGGGGGLGLFVSKCVTF